MAEWKWNKVIDNSVDSGFEIKEDNQKDSSSSSNVKPPLKETQLLDSLINVRY